jgi:hypothetical protein
VCVCACVRRVCRKTTIDSSSIHSFISNTDRQTHSRTWRAWRVYTNATAMDPTGTEVTVRSHTHHPHPTQTITLRACVRVCVTIGAMCLLQCCVTTMFHPPSGGGGVEWQRHGTVFRGYCSSQLLTAHPSTTPSHLHQTLPSSLHHRTHSLSLSHTHSLTHSLSPTLERSTARARGRTAGEPPGHTVRRGRLPPPPTTTPVSTGKPRPHSPLRHC